MQMVRWRAMWRTPMVRKRTAVVQSDLPLSFLRCRRTAGDPSKAWTRTRLTGNSLVARPRWLTGSSLLAALLP